MDEEFNTPNVTGSPEAIWLVYGELDHDDTHQECVRNGEVCWADESVYEADVRYIRADLVEERVKAATLAAHPALLDRLEQLEADLADHAQSSEALWRHYQQDLQAVKDGPERSALLQMVNEQARRIRELEEQVSKLLRDRNKTILARVSDT